MTTDPNPINTNDKTCKKCGEDRNSSQCISCHGQNHWTPIPAPVGGGQGELAVSICTDCNGHCGKLDGETWYPCTTCGGNGAVWPNTKTHFEKQIGFIMNSSTGNDIKHPMTIDLPFTLSAILKTLDAMIAEANRLKKVELENELISAFNYVKSANKLATEPVRPPHAMYEPLLECPFCGGMAVINEADRCVECSKCTGMTYFQDDIQGAIDQWNKRNK